MSHAPTDQVDAILRDWLADPDITIICGQWGNGSIMELVPAGRASLSAPRYTGAFAGLRDLHLHDQPHHLHLDLARLARAVYVISPSVCYGFRPSFEVRLCSDPNGVDRDYGIALAMRQPYDGGRLSPVPVRRYLRRLSRHHRRHPGVVGIRVVDGPVPEKLSARRIGDWMEIGACIEDEFGISARVTDAASLSSALEALRDTAS
ncbi:MAG: hypothetical protein GC151_02035 [Betaproteobacteria bacterium]|nr:hypothetical protein [Betaproteobacteria bacterium]